MLFHIQRLAKTRIEKISGRKNPVGSECFQTFPKARFNNAREGAKQRDVFHAAECKATSFNRKGCNKKADGGYGNRRDKAILAMTIPKEVAVGGSLLDP